MSQPDKRRGRGGALAPSPGKQAALELGLPVTDRVDDVLDGPAPTSASSWPSGGSSSPTCSTALPMVNLHFSLLPRWRGAAPVERAILAGDERTGVGLMAVEEGLDTGGVYDRAEVPIGPTRRPTSCAARLVDVGTDLLLDTLAAGLGEPPAAGGRADLRPQDRARPSWRIDWARPARGAPPRWCGSAARGRPTTATG